MNEVEEVRFWLDIINGMEDSCYDYGDVPERLSRVKLKDMADVDTDDVFKLCKNHNQYKI
jgi:hypothetical protein